MRYLALLLFLACPSFACEPTLNVSAPGGVLLPGDTRQISVDIAAPRTDLVLTVSATWDGVRVEAEPLVLVRVGVNKQVAPVVVTLPELAEYVPGTAAWNGEPVTPLSAGGTVIYPVPAGTVAGVLTLEVQAK
jgi:hypothetical protein